MRTAVVLWMAMLLSSSAAILGRAAQGTQSQAPASPHQAVLNKFCVSCHSEKLRTAELSLERIDVDHPANNPEIWEKVLHKLRTREMPPARMPRPDDVTYDSLAKY